MKAVALFLFVLPLSVFTSSLIDSFSAALESKEKDCMSVGEEYVRMSVVEDDKTYCAHDSDYEYPYDSADEDKLAPQAENDSGLSKNKCLARNCFRRHGS